MSMPSAERYRDLIAKLREASVALIAAEDDLAKLAIGSGALQAVILYLSKDAEVLDGQLTRPLAVVENAIHDAGRGAKPAVLFKPKPPPPEKKKDLPTKPSRTRRENVQGMLAFALELLKAGKMGTDLAARWIATEARKLNVSTEDGSPIDAKQIKQWRTDIRRTDIPRGKAKAPSEACETFALMRQIPNHAWVLNGTPVAKKRERCEALAMAIVKSLAGTMPRSAPKMIRPR
jgi:hypothetical protein